MADGWAYIVRGTTPVYAWQVGDVVPTPTPLPSKVAGIVVLEQQETRTKLQASVLSDPTWRLKASSLPRKFLILDADDPKAAAVKAAVALPLPVVCFVDGDGNVVRVVPLPETVEDMRGLIGGRK